MQLTSITNLVRNGKKEFSRHPFSTVISNNEPIGMIISSEMTEALEKSGALQDLQEELWEYFDPVTRSLIESQRAGSANTAISLDLFRKTYEM